VSNKSKKGIFRNGWTASVDDYAISGGWSLGGEALVVADASGGIFAFDGKSGEVLWSQKEVHDGSGLATSIHPNGTKFATAGKDGQVLVWDVSEGNVMQTLDAGSGWVENIAWSPDGKWLAASCSRQVRVFNEDGKETWQSDNHPSTVSTIAWSSPDELATACYGRVSFFEAVSGKLSQKLEWQGSLVSMVLSPDGDIIACGSQDNSVHFWRRSSGKDSMMSGYPGKPSALAFSANGTLLATGGGQDVTVWSFQGDGPEGTEPGVLIFHEQPITALTFACHGMNLASGSRDGEVAIWSLKNGKEGKGIGVADTTTDVVSQLYWRPDDRALAALDAQGGVTVWRI
jgi:WD40 repeat protein|tara:strand:+ start:64 stop:1095 length:1032 start_codon:yes stop_codon:yes gene_type:complete